MANCSLTGTVNCYVYFFEGLTLATGSFSYSFTSLGDKRSLWSFGDSEDKAPGMTAFGHLSKDLGAKCLQSHCVRLEGGLEILIPGWRRDWTCVPKLLLSL